MGAKMSNQLNKLMVFSDTDTEEGMVQEMDRLCISNETSYPIKEKTARVNQAQDRFAYLGMIESKK